MNEALSLIKNSTAFATSSAVPILLSGVDCFNCSISSAVRAEFILVSITPGDMQFTLTPAEPSSAAIAFVRLITADFEAE